MPLTKAVTVEYVLCDYHVADEVQLLPGNTGVLKVRLFVSAAAFAGGASPQAIFEIPIGADGKFDGDDVWTRAPWADFGDGKTQAQRETALKAHKGRYGTEIADYTTATGP